MPFIEWDDSLSVGIAELDAQHKYEAELINKLHDAPKKDKQKIFHELAEHTVTHFKTEEMYFDRFSYRKADAHKEAHKTFLQQAARIGRTLDAGEDISDKDEHMIKSWLINHIKFMDKKYTRCFKNNGLA